MYEPKYLPQLNESISAFSGVRLSIVHHNEYLHCDNPDADPLHIHNCLEIFLNVSSDVSFLVNNNLYPIIEGNAVISRPGDIHMGIFHKSAVQEYMCIWIDADFTSPLFSFLRKEDFSPLFSFDEQTKKKLQSLAFLLLDVCNINGSELEKISTLLQILAIFEKKTPHDTTQADIPETLQNILDDIHENFSIIRSVNDILASHFVSSATLTRWFRKYLHTSPREYLESVRLSNAVLLLSNGRSVTDACMRSGFSDCSHFILLFKKKFGETPLQYKKKSNTNPPFQT
jgi:AraC-like DNA-binding protein